MGRKRLTDDRLSAVSVLHAAEGAKFHIVSQIDCRRLFVTSDELAAKSALRQLKSWGLNAKLLPPRDDVLLARKGFSSVNLLERMNTLASVVCGDVDVVVTSADALLQQFPARRLVERFSMLLKKEEVISPTTLADKLAEMGYARQSMIADVGDFAVRGDILDVYAVDGNAYRINFFDELIENIKVVDVETMSSSSEVERVFIAPTSDVLIDEKGYEKAREGLKKHLGNKNAQQIFDNLSIGACDSSFVWALPFMADCNAPLLDFFQDGEPTVVVFDEPKVIFDKLSILRKEFAGRIDTLLKGGEIAPEHKDECVSAFELKRELLLVRKLSFASLTMTNNLFDPKLVIEPKTRAVTKYYLDFSSLVQDVKSFILNDTKVIFACADTERARLFERNLRENDVYAEFSADGEGDGKVLVTPLKVETGVNYSASKVVLVGTSECIGKQRSSESTFKKQTFSVPKAGDYVVHRIHGIGLCEGTRIMKIGEFEKEYIVLKYRDGDILYVATDQMNNLQKFVGEENPRLSKMGGKEFAKEKEKVKKSVRQLAVNLVELYARREKLKGYKYSADTVWQKEFEDNFEYEETPDQLKAISEIKRDMEDGKVMDRLLVGDVGFGKTEVAFRAMFKTALDGKQAVLLAPTTILARQHYENLVERLKPFGLKCGLLTRLQSAAENKQLLEDLKQGNLFLVIATHKVLAKSVEFADLGLLVLDEEQRFGVEHKEKLKEKYPTVNVLTLSATPIPRTLNMSLTGVRDISMLETAPQGRLPVQTYVVEYSDATCVDAVMRETARGGQTLILLNDIDALDGFAAKLAELTEGKVRIITAHGQMNPSELEKRIGAFYDKQYDVLVATTIIENGIDLPDANTLIVINSGKFGLSQLYQLRGRVGRRGALAHAYFTVPANDSLTVNAEKRLDTLLENTDIGSGFKVALADLSIRGAGTLLGAEQSGHIERVGYEMYLEILDETIREIRTGEKAHEIRDCEMRVDIAAFISDDFVSSRDKLKIYKQIAGVSSISSRDKLIEDLEQVYGKVDLPLENLINVALLKNLASRQDASKVMINKNGAGVYFYDASVFKNEALIKTVADNAGSVVLTSTIPPALIFEVNRMTPEQKLEKLIRFFASIG